MFIARGSETLIFQMIFLKFFHGSQGKSSPFFILCKLFPHTATTANEPVSDFLADSVTTAPWDDLTAVEKDSGD